MPEETTAAAPAAAPATQPAAAPAAPAPSEPAAQAQPALPEAASTAPVVETGVMGQPPAETGAELPQAKCPNCGAELTREENRDGSYTVATCEHCYPAYDEKAAAAAAVPAETGVTK